jgi:hypothetical protein
MESHCQKMKSDPLWDEQSHLNGQSICWHLEKKRTLEIQGSRRSAEYVLSAVAGRSAETNYCKDGWKDAEQIK